MAHVINNADPRDAPLRGGGVMNHGSHIMGGFRV